MLKIIFIIKQIHSQTNILQFCNCKILVFGLHKSSRLCDVFEITLRVTHIVIVSFCVGRRIYSLARDGRHTRHREKMKSNTYVANEERLNMVICACLDIFVRRKHQTSRGNFALPYLPCVVRTSISRAP